MARDATEADLKIDTRRNLFGRQFLGDLDREKITTMVITHDVDEAIYMSDRICMMTNGPEATVGQMLEVPFTRPRNRSEVLDHPRYYDFRFALIAFLEKQEHAKDAHVKSIHEKLREGKNEPVAAS